MANQIVSLYAVGDIHPDRATNGDEMFDLVRPILKEADITFAQLEGVYSEKGTLQPHLASALALGDPRCLLAFKNAGFKVLGCAGNHSMAWTSFLDMLESLRAIGIAGIGVGKDIDEARKPAILNIRGTRIGFLARNAVSNLPAFHADVGKPGTAPLRVYTSYEVVDPQPGISPVVHTRASKEDVEDIVDDIKNLRPQVDVLVWSCHWGLHMVPRVLAEYETEVAHKVIDAGADLILGHHSHLLKGIEVYKGKAIFYSMGNFAFDIYQAIPRQLIEKYGPYKVLETPEGAMAMARFNERVKRSGQWDRIGGYDPEYPTYQFPTVSRMSLIVKCSIQGRKIQRVTLVPVLVNKKAQPEAVSATSKSGKEIVRFLEQSSAVFNTKLPIDGDEAVVIKS